MIRIQDYHLHLPHYSFDHTRNMRLLYAMRLVRDLVNKSALFFLPIFLYSLGTVAPIISELPFSDFQKGMITIATYLFSQGLFNVIVAIPCAQLVGKIGHQRSMIISYFLRLVAFSALYHAKTEPWLIVVAMLFEGIQTPLFWNSYHTILSQSALKRHMGQDLGVMQFILQLASVIAPAIGGTLALLFGMEILFLIGLLGTLLGAIAALLMDLEIPHDSVRIGELKSWLKDKEYRELSLSFVGRYLNDVTLFIWPLYVFLIIGKVERVGYLYTFSLFSAMLLSFFVGMYIDHHKSRKPFIASGGLLSVIWLFRLQIANIWSIAIVDTFEKLTANFHWLVYDSLMMRRGKGSQALSYFAYREVIIGASAAVFWLIFGMFFALFDGGWNMLFVIASVGVLMSLYIRDRMKPGDAQTDN